MEANLIEYLPYEIRKYKDFQEITSAENPEFNILYNKTEKLLKEAYIMTATEWGIKRFEKILKITPLPTDTLEDRRIRILTKWSIDIPYTWRFLIRQLNAICGVGNYDVELKENDYTIDLETYMTTQSQYNSLMDLVKNTVPVNMVVNSSNTLEDDIDFTMESSTVLMESKTYTITHDKRKDVEVVQKENQAVGITEWKNEEIYWRDE